jgi:hypothetical protein
MFNIVLGSNGLQWILVGCSQEVEERVSGYSDGTGEQDVMRGRSSVGDSDVIAEMVPIN